MLSEQQVIGEHTC